MKKQVHRIHMVEGGEYIDGIINSRNSSTLGPIQSQTLSALTVLSEPLSQAEGQSGIVTEKIEIETTTHLLLVT